MAVKKHVFGSNAERSVWDKLRHRWGDRYSLYPNLPFLMVFDTKGLVDVSEWPEVLPNPTVSEQELNRLKKTSIDFTLCDAEGAPLMCVEFDGLQEGFNVGTRYKASEPTDPWRDAIMSLKLNVAHGSLFPYFVVGSEHFKDISDAVRVCIVDMLIGSILAGMAIREQASYFTPEVVGMTSEDFEWLSRSEQDEIIADWFVGVEAEADVAYNPVFGAVYDLQRELGRRLGPIRHSTHYVYKPSLESAATPIERARLMRKALLHGAECTVTTAQFGAMTRTVWLPNFNTPGFSAYGFLNELAQLVALDALRSRLNAHS